MNILGISAFYHDSAACLVRDGTIVAAVQGGAIHEKEARRGVPAARDRLLPGRGGIDPSGLDIVAFYDKPLLKFDRLLGTYVAYAPAGLRSFMAAMPLWLGRKLHIPREMDRGLRRQYRKRYVVTDHHESMPRARSFPLPSPRRPS